MLIVLPWALKGRGWGSSMNNNNNNSFNSSWIQNNSLRGEFSRFSRTFPCKIEENSYVASNSDLRLSEEFYRCFSSSMLVEEKLSLEVR